MNDDDPELHLPPNPDDREPWPQSLTDEQIDHIIALDKELDKKDESQSAEPPF